MPVQGAGADAGTVLQRRYRVAARIASGGMGSVYRGWDLRLDRPVAIKLLHPHLAEEADVRDRFHAEARHAARVRHANVVAVLDADEQDGRPFIVMELVDGPSLRDRLDQRTRLTPPELLAFLTGACAGLDAVHHVDLVHRDVKPENLLHDPSGQVRVADFGIARALDSTWLTPDGAVIGSVQYMAPEVVLGERATWSSDQYSLGIVAFEALTGRTPLPAEVPLAAALRHTREQVPAPSTVWSAITPQLDRVIMTATAKAPDDRFASLDRLLAALSAAVGDVNSPPGNGTGAAAPPGTALLPAPYAPTGHRRPAGPRAVAASELSVSPRLPAKRPVATAPPRAAPRPATHRPPRASRPPATALPSTADRRAVPPSTAPPGRNHVKARGPHTLVEHRTVFVRARVSVLAIIALAATLVQAGAVTGLLLGLWTLRRINRSQGRLRGEAVAGLAVVVGMLRLIGQVLPQL